MRAKYVTSPNDPTFDHVMFVEDVRERLSTLEGQIDLVIKHLAALSDVSTEQLEETTSG